MAVLNDKQMRATRAGAAGAMAPSDPQAASPEKLDELRTRLREGQHIVIVDDSLSSCEGTSSYLNQYFPGRVSFFTDSRSALSEVAAKAAQGKCGLLVIDMDMPGMSGREFVYELAKRGIFLPFVVLSGAQGSEETRAFMAQLSLAAGALEWKSRVSERLAATGGIALAYVAKEDAVLHPEHLLQAVDAMLYAGAGRVNHLDLVLEASIARPPILGTPPVQTVQRIFAALADEGLAMISTNREFLEKLNVLAATWHVKPGCEAKAGGVLEILSKLFSDPARCSYQRLMHLKTPAEFGAFRHDLLGSKGVHTWYSQATVLRFCFVEGSEDQRRVKDLCDSYAKRLQTIVGRFVKLEELLGRTSFLRVTSVGPLIEELASAASVPVTISGSAVIGAAGDDLSIALRQAIDNAADSIAGRTDGQVRVLLDVKGFRDIPAAFRAHFSGVGYSDEEGVAVVRIEDNGGGFPSSVIEAWQAGLPVPSTKGEPGRTGSGLSLMRETVSNVHGGLVSLENNGDRATVTFYIPQKERAG